MPYARRRYSRKGNYRRTASNKSIAIRKPSARTQKQQILSLNKKINAVSKKVSGLTYKVMHHRSWNDVQLYHQTANKPYMAFTLNDFGSWTEVFGQGNDTSDSGKYINYKTTIDMDITPKFEEEMCTFSVFFCTPKNQLVVSSAGGAQVFGVEDLEERQDYVIIPGTGQVMMNKKRWNVVKYLRLKTQPIYTKADGPIPPQEASYVNATRNNRRVFSIKNNIKVTNRQQVSGQQQFANWKAVRPYQLNANARLMCFIFTDNAYAIDGAPTLNMGVLHQGVVSQ